MPSKMRRTFGFVLASIAVPLALYACANDDYTAPGPKPAVTNEAATPTGEAGGDAPTDQAVTPAPVRCKAADFNAAASDAGGDLTNTTGGVTIAFPTMAGPAQYTNNCIKVKAGTVVTFTGSFTFHPLEPNGGDTPSPFPALSSADVDGGSLSFTMSTAGTFGYQCQFHPGTMFGAIQVVP
jgi:plastocyanin